MSKSVRASSEVVKSFRRRGICQCASLLSNRNISTNLVRNPPTASEPPEREERYGNRGRELREGPRWLSTPPRMKAPVRLRSPVYNNYFFVNNDPARLDEAYDQVLGEGGREMLTDEVKWLAITHKSFDHGRRGFNDRLAFLGKRIAELQTSLTLLDGSSVTPFPETQDRYKRKPFRHPALEGLAGVNAESKAQVLSAARLGELAERYGLDTVLRWKPKRMANLTGSGLPAVSSQALYAIVGAVALQKGGVVANNVVQERILSPLGLQSRLRST